MKVTWPSSPRCDPPCTERKNTCLPRLVVLSGLPRRSSWQLYRPLSSGCSRCRVRLQVMPPGPGAKDRWTFSTGNWEEDGKALPWRLFEWYNTSTGARPLRRFRLTPSTAKSFPFGGRQGSMAVHPAHVSTKPTSTEPGASPEGRRNKIQNMTCSMFGLSEIIQDIIIPSINLHNQNIFFGGGGGQQL